MNNHKPDAKTKEQKLAEIKQNARNLLNQAKIEIGETFVIETKNAFAPVDGFKIIGVIFPHLNTNFATIICSFAETTVEVQVNTLTGRIVEGEFDNNMLTQDSEIQRYLTSAGLIISFWLEFLQEEYGNN